MTENAALVAAFQALATTVAGINPPALPVAAPPPPAAAAPLLDPFTDDPHSTFLHVPNPLLSLLHHPIWTSHVMAFPINFYPS